MLAGYANAGCGAIGEVRAAASALSRSGGRSCSQQVDQLDNGRLWWGSGDCWDTERHRP